MSTAAQPDLQRAITVPTEAARTTASTPTPANRIRLFRFQPGFLSEPPGLETDDRGAAPEPDDGPEFVSLAFGNDNPFFDFRQRGDPGGVGYARVNTQVQLLDTEKTALSIAVQATTPAGLEYDGLPDSKGPTVLTPALSVFHALDEVTGMQAFVGKHVPIQNSAGATVRRDVQYGMALHRPVATGLNDPLRNLFLSFGALGLYRIEKETRAPVSLEVVPGLHYRAGENWWISGGMSLPVGGARTDGSQLWQVTCSVQF